MSFNCVRKLADLSLSNSSWFQWIHKVPFSSEHRLRCPEKSGFHPWQLLISATRQAILRYQPISAIDFKDEPSWFSRLHLVLVDREKAERSIHLIQNYHEKETQIFPFNIEKEAHSCRITICWFEFRSGKSKTNLTSKMAPGNWP